MMKKFNYLIILTLICFFIICLFPQQAEAQKLSVKNIYSLKTKNIKIDMQIYPAKHLLKASATITFEVLPNRPMPQLFLLDARCEVESIIDHKTNKSIKFTRKDASVILSEKLPFGEHTLTFNYSGVLFNNDKSLKAHIDENGAQFEDSTYWHPSPSLFDVFTSTVKVRVPVGFKAVSGGIIKEAYQQGEYEVFVWENMVGARRGIPLMIGKYTILSQKAGKITVNLYLLPQHYVLPQHIEQGNALLTEFARIIKFYNEKFYPYPYPQISLVETPYFPPFLGRGICSGMVLIESKAFDVPLTTLSKRGSYLRIPYFLAHETSHQYWGNLVFSDMDFMVIVEGMAQCSAALYIESTQGKKQLNEIISYLKQDYQAIIKEHPDVTFRKGIIGKDKAYGFIAYNKGALFFLALRKKVGDEKFYLIMNKVIKQYYFDLISLEDFEKIVLEESPNKEDMKLFFKKWLDEKGLPEGI